MGSRTGMWVAVAVAVLAALVAVDAYQNRDHEDLHVLDDEALVPFWVQGAAPWGGETLGDSAWTMRESGCLVTSLSMAFAGLGVRVCEHVSCHGCFNVESPLDVLRVLNENDAFTAGGGLRWPPVYGLFAESGVTVERRTGLTEDLARSLLTDSAPTLLVAMVNKVRCEPGAHHACGDDGFRARREHWVTVVAATEHSFVVHDPASRAGRLTSYALGESSVGGHYWVVQLSGENGAATCMVPPTFVAHRAIGVDEEPPSAPEAAWAPANDTAAATQPDVVPVAPLELQSHTLPRRHAIVAGALDSFFTRVTTLVAPGNVTLSPPYYHHATEGAAVSLRRTREAAAAREHTLRHVEVPYACTVGKCTPEQLEDVLEAAAAAHVLMPGRTPAYYRAFLMEMGLGVDSSALVAHALNDAMEQLATPGKRAVPVLWASARGLVGAEAICEAALVEPLDDALDVRPGDTLYTTGHVRVVVEVAHGGDRVRYVRAIESVANAPGDGDDLDEDDDDDDEEEEEEEEEEDALAAALLHEGEYVPASFEEDHAADAQGAGGVRDPGPVTAYYRITHDAGVRAHVWASGRWRRVRGVRVGRPVDLARTYAAMDALHGAYTADDVVRASRAAPPGDDEEATAVATDAYRAHAESAEWRARVERVWNGDRGDLWALPVGGWVSSPAMLLRVMRVAAERYHAALRSAGDVVSAGMELGRGVVANERTWDHVATFLRTRVRDARNAVRDALPAPEEGGGHAAHVQQHHTPQPPVGDLGDLRDLARRDFDEQSEQHAPQ